MKIEYSEELRKYLQKKGRSNVLLHTITPAGCCGGAPELIVDLLKSEDVDAAMKPGIKSFDGEMGKVLMEFGLVPEDPDATISLGLSRFLGLSDVTVTGIRQLA